VDIVPGASTYMAISSDVGRGGKGERREGEWQCKIPRI